MPIVLELVCWLSVAWWGMQVVLLLRAWRRMERLGTLDPTTTQPWPKLSLVIPARNEAAGLEQALRSKLASSYPNLELVLVNDRSTDETGSIAEGLAAKDERLKVIHLDALPPEWLGKVYAMARGFEATTGSYVLFSDADVEIAPGVFERVIAESERRQLDFLTVFPSVRLRGLFLNLALSTLFRVLFLFSRPWAMKERRSRAYFGVGAFNLVRRAAFARTRGLEWLRLEAGDDVALGWMMKRAEFRCAAFLGAEMVALDFYPTFDAMMRSVEKNGGSAPFPALVGSVGAMTLLELGFLFGLGFEGPWWWFSSIPFVLAPVIAFGSARMMRYPAWSSPLAPSGILFLGFVMLRSAVLCLMRGGIRWRETFYPIATISKGRRLFTARRESVLRE